MFAKIRFKPPASIFALPDLRALGGHSLGAAFCNTVKHLRIRAAVEPHGVTKARSPCRRRHARRDSLRSCTREKACDPPQEPRCCRCKDQKQSAAARHCRESDLQRSEWREPLRCVRPREVCRSKTEAQLGPARMCSHSEYAVLILGKGAFGSRAVSNLLASPRTDFPCHSKLDAIRRCRRSH